jgi:Pretoxin HINT domain
MFISPAEAAHPDSRISPPRRENGCFVAGTLVHTPYGLRPVEQIAVGDLVMSLPEDGSGEAAYKRVLKTVEYDDKSVHAIYYMVDGDLSKTEAVFVTGVHPFWVEGRGWTPAEHLYVGNNLRLPGAGHAEVCSRRLVEKSATADVGFVQNLAYGTEESEDGQFVDLRGETPVIDWRAHELLPNDIDSSPAGETDALPRRVFNLEVDEYHTYLVGEHGVLVHDVSG